jgi:hypothetical protein
MRTSPRWLSRIADEKSSDQALESSVQPTSAVTRARKTSSSRPSRVAVRRMSVVVATKNSARALQPHEIGK